MTRSSPLAVPFGATLLAVGVALSLLLLPQARPPRAIIRTPALAAILPTITPAQVVDMSPDAARASNAAVPLADAHVRPATGYVYRGTPADLTAARTCLAAAEWYEAGDDRAGEQAVAQVVLNRLRHPAFPKTVCGVVLQGSQRRTGCQFTFTCDGALGRTPSPEAWLRARRIADDALAATVFAPVGTATHYHTDWVVPYWRDTLVKIAQVHTQIFYRLPGAWGAPAAFHDPALAPEPISGRIAALADPGAALPGGDDIGAEERESLPLASLQIAGVPPHALGRSVVRAKDEAASQYILQLDPVARPGGFAVLGFTICGGKADCLVLGWTSAADVPRSLPVLPVGMRTVAFLYRKSSLLGEAQALWDCDRFPRPLRSQCLPGTGAVR